MEQSDRKKHWETIYKTKKLEDVSWYQPVPTTSLKFLTEYNIPTSAKIIDIGGGDSFLADHLLDLGYTNITVLDISAASLERAQQRLGNRSKQVKWIVCDVTTFEPTEQYDFWHDRAAFHFITEENEITKYIHVVQKSLKPSSITVIGTFSEQSPKKCSGIEIKQYSETSLTEQLKMFFEKVNCITVNHQTPFDTTQNFVFCSFKKLKTN